MPTLRLTVIFTLACFIAFSFGAICATPTLAQSGGQGTLILKVTGLLSEKGQVKIALFNSSETWLGEHPAYSATINLDSQSVTWKLIDVAYGVYGIAVFHDENKNGKIDKNFLGIPQEAYGFSNNMRVVFGPPSWEKSKFAVTGSITEISIEVK
jgi:uncharacterized protein (DUF2141 family)